MGKTITKYISRQQFAQRKKPDHQQEYSQYSPTPVKQNTEMDSSNPLLQANPFPSLNEEAKEVKQYHPEGYQYAVNNTQNISNYDYHQHNMRNQKSNGQPHEVKKANFEQNRRSNITKVSNHIVSSREQRTSDNSTGTFGNKISHTKNTNQGYVRMTGGPQFGGKQMTSNDNIHQYRNTEQHQAQPLDEQTFAKPRPSQPEPKKIKMKVSEPVQKQVGKGRNKEKDSILKQYSHNLPPHQVEYKSGFQEIPAPMYNVSEETMQRKAQPKPLPGNSDLDDIDFYQNLR